MTTELSPTKSDEPHTTFIRYDREFLLQFRQLCKEPLLGLTSLSFIERSEPQIMPNPPRRQSYHVLPSLGPRPVTFGRPVKTCGGSRPGIVQRPSATRPKKRDEESKPAEGAWAPSRHKRASALDENQKKLRAIKGLLNRLTEENFDQITEDQVLGAGIDNAELLKSVVQLTLEKAIQENAFAKIYARFCVTMNTKCPTFPTTDGKIDSFKTLLLNGLQKEFEQAHQPITDTDGPILTNQKRIEGTSTFIGELYNEKLISKLVIYSCLDRLLHKRDKPSQDDVLALSALLSRAGKTLDHSDPESKTQIDKLFDKMQQLAQHPQTLPRTRYMMMDMTELRKRGWEPKQKA